MTSDPIGLQGGVNTYGYVALNPNRFFDLIGLAKFTCSISKQTLVCASDDGRSESVEPDGVH